MRLWKCLVLGVHSSEIDGAWVARSAEHCELRLVSKVTRARLGVCRLEALLAAQKAQITGNALGSA